MMKYGLKLPGLAAVIIFAALMATHQGRAEEEHQLLLQVGDASWTYEHEQLKPLATKTHMSSRGTKKNPAIPLDVLLTKDTKLPVERIVGVAIIGEERSLFLEGGSLAHLKNLWLKFGTKELTLVPDTDETYKALRAVWGKPRLDGVERIFVYERRM
jgi:hypothetical protein